MKSFVFDNKQQYDTINSMWKSLGFNFACKRSCFHPNIIHVYLLSTSNN